LQQQLHRRAVLHHRLAPEQIQRLDAVGAFVDRVDAVVAPALLHRVLAGVAITTEDLDREIVRLERVLRTPGLDDGREQVEQQAAFAPHGFVRILRLIDQLRSEESERHRPFHPALLLQQHAPHVGMFDQRHRRRVRVLLVRVPTLAALTRVLQRVQVTDAALHHRAHADADALLVHHVEHVAQALMRLAHQLAVAVALPHRT
jgi:hypothetical protein